MRPPSGTDAGSGGGVGAPVAAARSRRSAEVPAVTCSKKVTGCGFPSMNIRNCSRRSPGTKRPALSRTVTDVCTSSLSTRNTSSSSSCGGAASGAGSCGAGTAGCCLIEKW